MVEITQGREEAPRSSLLVSDNQSPLSALFDIVSCDYRSHPPLRLVHELLVDFESVLGSLGKESLVGNLANIDTRFR